MVKKLSTMIYTLLFLALSIPLLRSMEEEASLIPGYGAGERDLLDGILNEDEKYCYDPVHHIYHLDGPSETSMRTRCGQAALYYTQGIGQKLATNPQASFLTLTQYFYDVDVDHERQPFYNARASEFVNATHLSTADNFLRKLTSRHDDISDGDIASELNKETLFSKNMRKKTFVYSEFMPTTAEGLADFKDEFWLQRKRIKGVADDPSAYCIFIYPWKMQGGGYHWCTIAIRSTGKDGPLETLFADGMRWAILWNRSSGPDTSIAHIHQKAVAPMNILRFKVFLRKLRDGTLNPENPNTLKEIQDETSSREQSAKDFKSKLKAIFDKIPRDITPERLAMIPTVSETRTVDVPDTTDWYFREDGRPQRTREVSEEIIHPDIKILQDCIAKLYTDQLYKELQKAWAAWARRTYPGLSAEDELREEAAIARRQKERENREDAEIDKLLPKSCVVCNTAMTTPISLPCGNVYQHASPVMPEDYRKLPSEDIPKADSPYIICYDCAMETIKKGRTLIRNEDPRQYYSFQCGCKHCNGLLSSATIELLEDQASPDNKKLFTYACAQYHGERWGKLFKNKYFQTFPLDSPAQTLKIGALIASIRDAQHPHNMRFPFSEIGECVMLHIVAGSPGGNPMTAFMKGEAQALLTQASTAANVPPVMDEESIRKTVHDMTPLLLNDLFRQRAVFYSKIDAGKIPTQTEQMLFLLARLFQCDEDQRNPPNSLKNLILYGNVYGEKATVPTKIEPGLSSEEFHLLEHYISEPDNLEAGPSWEPPRFALRKPWWTDEYNVQEHEFQEVATILKNISIEKDAQNEEILNQKEAYISKIQELLQSPQDEEDLAIRKRELEEIISALDQPGYATNTRAQRIIEDAKRLLQEKFPGEPLPGEEPSTTPPVKPLPEPKTTGPVKLHLRTSIPFDDPDNPDRENEIREGVLSVPDASVTLKSIFRGIAESLGIPEKKIQRIANSLNPLEQIRETSPVAEHYKKLLKIVLEPCAPNEVKAPKHQGPNKLTDLKTALQQLQTKLTALGRNLTRLKH